MRMEDILELYKQPYDPFYPVVCFDETNKQLTKDLKVELPMQPGQPRRYDYSYERNGVANIYMIFEPLAGIRYVEATVSKTKIDFAKSLKQLVDRYYPYAKKIRLVLDNYSSHQAYALYEVFDPSEARRILEKIEFHPTPVHASWLNAVEVEFSVLSRQILNVRIGSMEEMQVKLKQWQKQRNRQWKKMDWQFTSENARIKLKKLYPTLSC